MVLEHNHAIESQNWQHITSNDAFKLLRSDAQGLTNDEAQKRLRTFGQNTLPEIKRPSKLIIFVRQFKSPLIYILIITGIISFLAESVIDAGVILLIVVANAVIGYVQENKAENVLESLKELTAPKCKVRREGAVEIVDARCIVPGDILSVEAGDRVPADARLFVARNLRVDESMLTGESVTVDKLVVPYTSNMVYVGTIITEGRGEALVVKTGQRTEFGQIATSVQTSTREETPLQKDLARLGSLIKKISMSAINADIDRISLDTSVSYVWIDNPVYAKYLLSTFEWMWERSAPAAQRIEKLLKERPPQV